MNEDAAVMGMIDAMQVIAQSQARDLIIRCAHEAALEFARSEETRMGRPLDESALCDVARRGVALAFFVQGEVIARLREKAKAQETPPPASSMTPEEIERLAAEGGP